VNDRKYEAVIGLEIHAQLRTRTKIFCGCRTDFGAPPNSQVCPVCLGLPGALPVLNGRAVDYAVKAALALGGGLDITVDGVTSRVALTRIHMEEDAGKSLHEGFVDSDRRSYVDYNRSSVPLIEIVSEPDMRSAAEGAEFFSRLRDILVWLEVSDGNMEEGSLRCDANVSVRLAGESTLGTKAEVKNVNSFRYLEKALEYEIDRHIDILERGGRVPQETRLWDSASGRTHSMRSKEEAHDYRYFPEPDLPPLVVDTSRIARVLATMPELPEARCRRLVEQYAIPAYDAGVLTQSAALADYFEATARAAGNGKAASNWIMGEVLRTLNERGETIDHVPLAPETLAGLIALIDTGTISSSIAKDVFGKMYDSGRSAEAIVTAEGLAQIGDEDVLVAIVRDVVGTHADAVAQYRAGKHQTFGFLVGQVMKGSAGKANPKLASDLLKRELG